MSGVIVVQTTGLLRGTTVAIAVPAVLPEAIAPAVARAAAAEALRVATTVAVVAAAGHRAVETVAVQRLLRAVEAATKSLTG